MTRTPNVALWLATLLLTACVRTDPDVSLGGDVLDGDGDADADADGDADGPTGCGWDRACDPVGPIVTSPDDHFVTAPPATAVSDDGYVVAWTEVGDQFGAFFRRYAGDGTARGDAVRASPEGDHVTGTPAVAMNAAGAMAIAFTDVGEDFQVLVQAYSADGTALGGVRPVSPDGEFVVGIPTVTMGDDGSFVVGYSTGSDFRAYYRSFEADGEPRGSVAVSRDGGYVRWAPAVGIDDAGNVVAAWQDGGLWYACWDAAGERTLEPTPAFAGDDPRVPPTIAVSPSGRFAIGWGTSAQVFDACGSPAGDPVAPEVPDGLGPGSIERWEEGLEVLSPDHAAAMNVDGRFLLAWTLETTDPDTEFNVFAQRFDGQGEIVADAWQVTSDVFVSVPPAASAAPHRLATVVAWSRGDDFRVEHTLLFGTD